MVVSINDAVEAVLPVPCPAHRVVRVAFLEPADHVFISFIFLLLLHIFNFLYLLIGQDGFLQPADREGDDENRFNH